MSGKVTQNEGTDMPSGARLVPAQAVELTFLFCTYLLLQAKHYQHLSMRRTNWGFGQLV